VHNTQHTDLILRQFIHNALLEAELPGTSFEREEAEAEAAYLKAQADLDAWHKADAKRTAFYKELESQGLSPGSSSKLVKQLRQKPEYNFDPNLPKTSAKFEDAVEKAREKYGKYNPAAVGYKRTSKKAEKEKPADETPEFKNPFKGFKWSGGPVIDRKPVAMQWVPWPEDVEKFSSAKFGKQKEGERGEAVGTGPGEKWLASLFGGSVVGGGSSYDIIMPGGTKCEVKELDSASSLVRPATEGIAALEKSRRHMNVIMSQIKDFIEAVEASKEALEDVMTPEEEQIVSYVAEFFDNEQENIVGKGEISRERIAYLRSVLKQLQILKTSHSGSKKDTKNVKTTVTLNKKTATVSRPTFIDIAKRVEADVGETEILSDFETWDLVLNTLKDSAFTDYVGFLNSWYESLSVEDAFKAADGLFIVNEQKGFYWIPKSSLKSMLRFEVVSQGRPKFRFLGW